MKIVRQNSIMGFGYMQHKRMTLAIQAADSASALSSSPRFKKSNEDDFDEHSDAKKRKEKKKKPISPSVTPSY